MKISLSETEVMWSVPHTNLQLSFKNTGPIDIDFNSLSDQNKLIVINAIIMGKIVSDTNINELRASMQPPENPEPKETIATPAVPVTSSDPLRELRIECDKILKRPWASVVKELGKISDVRKLRCMLTLEKANKGRKRVLSKIEDRVSAMAEEVKKNIEDNENPNAKDIQYQADRLADLMKVIESEEEQVEVKV